MSTLYVSDLDGTLLRSNEVTSEYTNHVINSLTQQGMIFSYATARSLVTAKKVTRGLNAKIPLIVYNGAFVMDNITEEILIANYFDESVYSVLDELFANNIYPIVYAYIEGKEKFSFIPERCTTGMKKFLDSRSGDIRTNVVKITDELKKGNLFYITCIDEPDKLKPFYEKYKSRFHCVYQKDIYTGEQWLEIMPLAASKSNAIKQLQGSLQCERLIVFGDGINDIDMFELADESYAVQNAHDELKKYATAIIASNDEDGVAKWLERHFHPTLVHQWNIADTITSVRMIASLFLLFLPFGSVSFLLAYTLTGLTDVLDGWLARKTGTASDFGARLDSIADLLFYGIILFRLFPVLWQRMPTTIWYAVTAIVLARLGAYAVAAIRYHLFASLHTWLNKLTGAAVFLLPYVLAASTGVVFGWTVCVLAFIASIEELMIHLCRKEYRADRKSIFTKMSKNHRVI